jgi:hypothetical protein
MPISSLFREPSLLSPRTAKYVEAMIREGDRFDYDNWLKRVRQEEAQAKQLSAPSTTGQAAIAQIKNRIRRSDNRHAWPRLAPAIPVTGPIRRSGQNLKDTCLNGRLQRRLEKVQAAWSNFQASRARDAVYDYLDAVFSIVMRYKVRRRTKRFTASCL